MKEKQKNVPPVTEKKPKKSELETDKPVDAEVLEPDKPKPAPEPPVKLKPDQRLALLEAQMQQADQNFKQIGTFLTEMEPLLKLSKQLAERQKAAEQAGVQPVGQQPQQGGGAGGLMANAGQFMPFLMQMLQGGGGTPIADELMKKVMNAGIEQMFMGTELMRAMQRKFMSEWGSVEVKKSLAKAESPQS